MTDFVTTPYLTTNSFQGFPLDGTETRNILVFNSAAAFYTAEGGFTAQLETPE